MLSLSLLGDTGDDDDDDDGDGYGSPFLSYVRLPRMFV